MRERDEKRFMQFQLDLQNCCVGCLVTVNLRRKCGDASEQVSLHFFFFSFLSSLSFMSPYQLYTLYIPPLL